MTNDLVDRIEGLDEATLLEAAQLLAASLATDEVAEVAKSPILERPLEHRGDLRDLCRVLLLSAAQVSGGQELVDDAVRGAGRKQLVLGGTELIAIAALAVLALSIVVTRGRTEETLKIDVKTDEDGSEKISIDHTVKYGVSPALAKLISMIWNRPAP